MGKTHDPAYVENALATMRAYRSILDSEQQDPERDPIGDEPPNPPNPIDVEINEPSPRLGDCFMVKVKPLLKSKTFWSGVIAFLAQMPKIGAHVGAVDPEWAAGTVGAILDVISAGGAVGAIASRAAADSKIEGIISTPEEKKQKQ